MKTDLEIYDSATPEAKRRLAAELMGWQEGTGMESILDSLYYISEHGRVMHIINWKPDESLDQVRLLENKVDDKEYDDALFNFLNQKEEASIYIHKEIATMTANEKLFYLFCAFRVIQKLKEME